MAKPLPTKQQGPFITTGDGGILCVDAQNAWHSSDEGKTWKWKRHIELDTRARLEAVPRTKQIGYYSDMYKLEFALPKFRMYRRVLSRVLADELVRGRGWTEDQAIDLGKQVLRGNVERIFFED